MGQKAGEVIAWESLKMTVNGVRYRRGEGWGGKEREIKMDRNR